MLTKSGQDPYALFEDYWKRSYNFGKTTQVFDNDNITYGHKDMDFDLLKDEDYKQFSVWAIQLGITKNSLTPKECKDLYTTIGKKKKNPYVTPTKNEMKYFNRTSWTSMRRKGHILLKSFEDQFLPKVNKVIAVQKRADIKDPGTGDSIVGYIDMILEVEGYDKPIIIDLKTASKPYTDEQLEYSDQLTLYCAMKGMYALDRTDFVNTNLVGYLVLCKEINKDKEAHCKTCGHFKAGRHKTCNNEITDPDDPNKTVRCGGEWKEKVVINPHVQFMVAEKSQQQIDNLLEDIAAIIAGMKSGIIYKNTNNCSNWFGAPCPYKNYCHKGDSSGLVKK